MQTVTKNKKIGMPHKFALHADYMENNVNFTSVRSSRWSIR